MDDIDSLRLALEAEKHNHRKDNEYLLGRIERLRKANANASYYLTPNQGETSNRTAAQCWLRTAYPCEHPNYLTPERVIELGFTDVDAEMRWPT